MKPDRPATIPFKENRSSKGGLFRSQGFPGRRDASGLVPQVNLISFLRRFLYGISRLAIVVRYWFSQMRIQAVPLPKWRISWWKLALAALTVFIILKKDIQFSINMRAPEMGAVREEGNSRQREDVEKMSLVQPASLFGSGRASAEAPDKAQALRYIDRFDGVAVSEMEKFGIPASIKLAQGLLESSAGQTASARRNNNHFGNPLAGRSYSNAWENWREHSLLLYHEYSPLFENGKNYKKWAKGLRQAGYSKDRHYDRKLIEIIEKYKLDELDEKK